MEAAVRDRRDEPLLAELGAFLGRDVGGDTLQLAGDAPLDLDLSGRLGLGVRCRTLPATMAYLTRPARPASEVRAVLDVIRSLRSAAKPPPGD